MNPSPSRLLLSSFSLRTEPQESTKKRTEQAPERQYDGYRQKELDSVRFHHTLYSTDRLARILVGNLALRYDQGTNLTSESQRIAALPRRQRMRSSALHVLLGILLASVSHAELVPCPADDQRHISAIDVAWDETSTLFVGTSCGLFRGDRFGSTWEQIGTGITHPDIHTLVIDGKKRSKKRTIYVGTHGGGVFRSTDDGQSFSPVNHGLSSLFIRDLALDPELSEVIFAATPGGLFRSRDSGDSWQQILSSQIDQVEVDPRTSSTVYIATGRDGARVSKDYGGTWSGGTPLLRNGNATALAVDLARPNSVYLALDDGIYHGRLGGETPEYSRVLDGKYTSLAVSPVNPDTLFAGGRGAVSRSLDGGESWKRTPSEDGWIFGLLVDPFAEVTAYLATRSGHVSRSHDEGDYWQTIKLPSRQPRPPTLDLLTAQAKSWRDRVGRIEALPGSRRPILTWLDDLEQAITTSSVGNLRELICDFPGEDFETLSRQQSSFSNLNKPTTVSYSPDGRFLLLTYQWDDGLKPGSEIQLFDLAKDDPGWDRDAPWRENALKTGNLALEPPELVPTGVLDNAGEVLAWAHDSSVLLTRDALGRLLLWTVDLARGGNRIPPTMLSSGPISHVTAASFSADGQRVVLASGFGAPIVFSRHGNRRWDLPLRTGADSDSDLQGPLKAPAPPHFLDVLISNQGRVTAITKNQIYVWATLDQPPLSRFVPSLLRARAVTHDSTGRWLAWIHNSHEVWVADLVQGTILQLGNASPQTNGRSFASRYILNLISLKTSQGLKTWLLHGGDTTLTIWNLPALPAATPDHTIALERPRLQHVSRNKAYLIGAEYFRSVVSLSSEKPQLSAVCPPYRDGFHAITSLKPHSRCEPWKPHFIHPPLSDSRRSFPEGPWVLHVTQPGLGSRWLERPAYYVSRRWTALRRPDISWDSGLGDSPTVRASTVWNRVAEAYLTKEEWSRLQSELNMELPPGSPQSWDSLGCEAFLRKRSADRN